MPVITLVGDATVSHEKGAVYTDAGAAASDLSGVDLTSSDVSDSVDIVHTVGSYTYIEVDNYCS